jgi:sugar lactone lactonase YvrE
VEWRRTAAVAFASLRGEGKSSFRRPRPQWFATSCPRGISLVDLGLHNLRDVAFPEHVFEARIEGVPQPATAPPRNLRTRITGVVANRRQRVLIAAPAIAVLLAAVLITSPLLRQPETATGATHGTSAPKAASLTNMTITTVAGTGVPGYDARGNVRATDAELNHPSGIAVDANGNVFIADTLNNLVRELRPDGTLFTVVGGGTQFAVDGQIGTEVTLNRPTALQVDNWGNLCLADTGDNRVLKVDPGDHVTLIAGSGAKGAPAGGDAASLTKFDTPTGVDCVFNGKCSALSICSGGGVGSGTSAVILDSGTRQGWLVASGTVEPFVVENPATNYQDMAPLAPGGAPDLVQTNPTGQPDSIAGGDVYLSDSGANRIVKITAGGKVLSFAGTGVAGYSGDNRAQTAAELRMPEGLALDASFRLYIADTGNNVIRVVDLRSGKIFTIAGNGTAGFFGASRPATEDELFAPTAVAVAPDGHVYIADTNNNRVRMLSPSV